jgi:hypothetical protein
MTGDGMYAAFGDPNAALMRARRRGVRGGGGRPTNASYEEGLAEVSAWLDAGPEKDV